MKRTWQPSKIKRAESMVLDQEWQQKKTKVLKIEGKKVEKICLFNV